MLLSVPTSAEVLANVQPGDGVTTNLVSKAFGSEMSCCAVALDRHDWQGDDGRPEAAEFYVWFKRAGLDDPTLHPRDIPALIDALSEMYRAWLHVDPECLA